MPRYYHTWILCRNGDTMLRSSGNGFTIERRFSEALACHPSWSDTQRFAENLAEEEIAAALDRIDSEDGLCNG